MDTGVPETVQDQQETNYLHPKLTETKRLLKQSSTSQENVRCWQENHTWNATTRKQLHQVWTGGLRQTDKLCGEFTGIVVVKKHQKTAAVMGMANLSDSNIGKKEHKKTQEIPRAEGRTRKGGKRWCQWGSGHCGFTGPTLWVDGFSRYQEQHQRFLSRRADYFY